MSKARSVNSRHYVGLSSSTIIKIDRVCYLKPVHDFKKYIHYSGILIGDTKILIDDTNRKVFYVFVYLLVAF